MSLCIAAAGLAVEIAVSGFTLAWTHTVEKTEWQEDWRIEGDRLMLAEARSPRPREPVWSRQPMRVLWGRSMLGGPTYRRSLKLSCAARQRPTIGGFVPAIVAHRWLNGSAAMPIRYGSA